jgi:hypothetical protein
MMRSGDFWLSYGWMLALAVTTVALIALFRRAQARKRRRERRRVRNLARQRVWDWLMMRQNVRRLTYRSDEDRA